MSHVAATSLALSPEQAELASAVMHWAGERAGRAATRQSLEDTIVDLVPLWEEAAGLGWTGLLVPDDLGGSAASWLDAAVVVEALAWRCSPLTLSPTLAVSSVLATESSEDAHRILKGVADGSVRFGTSRGGEQPWLVQAGCTATHVAVVVDEDVVIHDAAICEVSHRRLLDPSSGAVEMRTSGDPMLSLPGRAADLRTVLRLLLAAEGVGLAGASLQTAVEHAKVREAFGRVIGSFQAVKHHCAEMLLSGQLASAATWRAASAQGSGDAAALVDVAAYLSGTAALNCAKTAIQVLGGIGFTWEHDAHLYLRRAGTTLAQLGPLEEVACAAGRSRLDGSRPTTTISLPPEAEGVRREVEAFRDRVLAAAPEDRHAMVVDEGYLHPQWPAPWGRSAGPLEQLVVEEVLRGVDRTSALGETFWSVPIVLPTVLQHGTQEQVERWMRPSMSGALHWCQLFSEPAAGSDLAALRTRAIRVDGGWSVTGQKVWTSNAQDADLGMALVRTDPDAKKHRGITCMVVDMRTPGVQVRPLRQITGEAHFNEVFLDDVFVPDRDVLGPVDGGWQVALATLGHERLSLGGSGSVWTTGPFWAEVLDLVRAVAPGRPAVLARLGELTIREDGAQALHLRAARRALLGLPSGIDGTINKMVVTGTAHALGDLCLDLLGDRAAFADHEQAVPSALFLQVRMATIAGGTSEILRNLLAEQALGLPREPQAP